MSAYIQLVATLTPDQIILLDRVEQDIRAEATQPTPREIVDALYSLGFSEIAYDLASELDAREALLDEEDEADE